MNVVFAVSTLMYINVEWNTYTSY